MTDVSIQELVRKDLIYREEQGRQRYGAALHPYNGRSAILDAYDQALDLCVYLRQLIAELMLDPQAGNPPPLLQPHHRAARQRDTDDTVSEQYR